MEILVTYVVKVVFDARFHEILIAILHYCIHTYIHYTYITLHYTTLHCVALCCVAYCVTSIYIIIYIDLYMYMYI